MALVKTGPLTEDDLREIWRSVVDRSYREPLEQAGDGSGLEAHSQMWEVFSRVSRAIDVTTQAMFILPWSGQTNPPASGAEKAIVDLTWARTTRTNSPLRLRAGDIIVDHQIVDWGENEGVTVLTGLRFILLADVCFHPGDQGPYIIEAEAEKPGYSYNDPLLDTLVAISQPGSQFENDLATVTVTTATVAPNVTRVFVRAANEADMFVPEHVGQYLLFTAGSNIGKVGRIKAFTSPDPDFSLGSGVDLETLQTVQGTVFTGTFQVGEELSFTNGGPEIARGFLAGKRIDSGIQKLTYEVIRGITSSIIPTTLVTGVTSGATLTVSVFNFDQVFVSEINTAGWRILDWEDDYGLSVTNVESPSGGLAPWLDELGAERNINRAPNELDDIYRKRVATPSDVVTPNAIKRALNRTLGILEWCFREVGTEFLPGFFFDQDAYDYDTFTIAGTLTGTFLANERIVLEKFIPAGPLLYVVGGFFGKLTSANTILWFIWTQGTLQTMLTPATSYRVRGLTSGATFVCSASPVVPASIVTNRFRFVLDYASFRAFFLVGLPPLNDGEVGFAFDGGPNNAWDNAIVFDGQPFGAAAINARARQAIDTARAGGVGFGLYREDRPCSP